MFFHDGDDDEKKDPEPTGGPAAGDYTNPDVPGESDAVPNSAL